MSITVIPRQPAPRTGLGEFADAANPYIQQAFLMMLKRKQDEMQRQRNIEQAQQIAPQLFTETTPISEYQKYLPQGTELNLAGGLTPERQTEVARQLTQARGIKIPEKIRRFTLKTQGLQPSIDITTGQVSLKPEDAFQAYYKSLLPGAKEKPQQGDIVYRDATGAEVPASQAQADIDRGNTNYFLSRRDITKSGIKETQIAKPDDLDKIQATKNKTDLILTQTRDTLDTIAKVREGINKGYFGLYGVVPAIPGTDKYTWQQNINKLLASKMVDLMTKMKEASKTGATGFGQLSEKEGQILRDASTALKRGIAPQEAERILTNMEQLLNKVLTPSEQQIPQLPMGFSPDEWEVVNE